MTTDDKLDLVIELLADIHTVCAKMADKVGMELTWPESYGRWLSEHERGEVHGETQGSDASRRALTS